MADAPAILASGRFSDETAKLFRATDPFPPLHEAGNRKVSRMVRKMRRSGDPIPGGALVSRRGARGFAGRFAYEVSGSKAKPVLRYGNASRYARILALGGTIVPRKAKALTIPIAPEARGKRARDFPGIFRIGDILFIAKSRGRKKADRHTELIPLFVLKRRVTIPPFDWGWRWDASDERALLKSLRRQFEATS